MIPRWSDPISHRSPIFRALVNVSSLAGKWINFEANFTSLLWHFKIGKTAKASLSISLMRVVHSLWKRIGPRAWLGKIQVLFSPCSHSPPAPLAPLSFIINLYFTQNFQKKGVLVNVLCFNCAKQKIRSHFCKPIEGILSCSVTPDTPQLSLCVRVWLISFFLLS